MILWVTGFSVITARADDSAPIHCVFDLSALISAPAHCESVRRKLVAGLLPELQGNPSESIATVRVAVEMVHGRLESQVFFAQSMDPEKLIDHTVVSSVAELTAVANRQIRSEKLWMGRLVRSSDSIWSVDTILPSAPMPNWLTVFPKGGVWRPVGRGSDSSGKKRTVEQITGPEPAEADILVSAYVQRSDICIAIRDSDNLPLSEVEIYAQPEGFPDPRKLSSSNFVGTSDHSGMVRLHWEHLGAVYLLAVRNAIPLKNLVLLPTHASLKTNLTIPSKWRYEGDTISLDQYILAKRRDFAVLREKRKRREEAYGKVRRMIDDGQWDAALKVLDTLGANDPIAQELRHNVLAEKEGATIAELIHAADLAVKDKDYAAGKEYLKKAADWAKGDQRAEIADRLRQLEVAAAELHRQTATATQFLFEELPRLSISGVISQVARIENSVSVLCSARRVSELTRATDQLTQTIGLLDIAMAQRLDEMERLQILSDAEYRRLESTRNRLHSQLEHILKAMNR